MLMCSIVQHVAANVYHGADNATATLRTCRDATQQRARASVTVRVYDPDTPSVVIHQQDTGLKKRRRMSLADDLFPNSADIALVGVESCEKCLTVLNADVV